MSIVARVYGYPPDHNAGSEWMLHSILRPLAERGHRVEVWLSHPGKSELPYEIDGVHVVPFQAGIDFVARAATADVLVSHYENVPLVAGLAREQSIPVAVICHDNFSESFHNAAGADLVVYNSQWIRRDGGIFYARYPPAFLPRRSIVVRPPVIAAEYRTRPGQCVTLVNLNADKGGELFWQIAAWSPQWRFRGVRGAYGTQVMPPPRLPNCEVIDSVPGHRMREHVYSQARVVLMPSLYESWGRVAVEAFASGIPVIAHPTPGLVEALGPAGIFAYRDDPAAWIDVLNSLRDPGTWARASRRARARSDELSATSDLDLWCEAVETLPTTRPRGAGTRIGPSLSTGADSGGPPDDGVVHHGTPAGGRPRISVPRWMTRVFDERCRLLRGGGGRSPGSAPGTGSGPSMPVHKHMAAVSDRSEKTASEQGRTATDAGRGVAGARRTVTEDTDLRGKDALSAQHLRQGQGPADPHHPGHSSSCAGSRHRPRREAGCGPPPGHPAERHCHRRAPVLRDAGAGGKKGSAGRQDHRIPGGGSPPGRAGSFADLHRYPLPGSRLGLQARSHDAWPVSKSGAVESRPERAGRR
ncbi:glycosyltransferase family 4 protein [Streptomyces sp. WG5]|uniref:glycosyltransferase family 4 protein n=1 Tax=Streptomyces sp. WG5 TaxID=3417648 RepID=UPI003CF19A69